ncbi:ANKRD17 [Symbiodinium sp. CCMP2456]|nr:ANKRD17 [Symbiodinium sp. CCMP2456]
MLRIRRLSGQELTASADEIANAASLKKHLCKQYELPVFLQNLLILLHEGNQLGDGAKLEASMELQAVLTISGLSESDHRLAEKELLKAAAQNRGKVVRSLLEVGVAKDCHTPAGKTPLMLACAHGHLEIVSLLLGAGADQKCQSNAGNTALMFASNRGDVEVVRLLLGAGGHKQKNYRNGEGRTALMHAAAGGHLWVVRLLLDAGASVNLVDECGRTAAGLALDSWHFSLAQILFDAGASWKLS